MRPIRTIPEPGLGAYSVGPQVALLHKQRKVLHRIRSCVRRASYIYPSVRWYWEADIHWYGDDGETYPINGLASRRGKSGYTITIRAPLVGQTVNGFADTLIHELAHCIASEIETDEHPHIHSDLWGLIYARIYRQYFDGGT